MDAINTALTGANQPPPTKLTEVRLAEPYGKYSIRFTHSTIIGKERKIGKGILKGTAVTYDSIPGIAKKLLDQLTDLELGEITKGHLTSGEY